MLRAPASFPVLTAIIAGLTSLALPAAAAFAGPPYFSAETFDETSTAAAKEGKLLIVKATAEWCGPCKLMDTTTFEDERVMSFFETSAVGIEVDVDRDPARAATLGVRAMPTMIAFRGSEEVGRVVGYRDAGAFLAWARPLAPRGDDAGDRRTAKRTTITDLLDDTHELVEAGRHRDALFSYYTLWVRSRPREGDANAYRHLFLAEDMRALARVHGPSMDTFVEMRDTLDAKLKDKKGTLRDVEDWLILNEIVLQDRILIEVWMTLLGDSERAMLTKRKMQHIVGPILADQGEWDLLGSIAFNPKGRFDAWMDIVNAGDRVPARYKERALERAREQAAMYHAAMLTNGRFEDAWDLAEHVFSKLDGPATRETFASLVERLGVREPRHDELLGSPDATEDPITDTTAADLIETPGESD
ncbi:MAG: thioredoxin domain-containing protein [Planctomycetota bacterium]